MGTQGLTPDEKRAITEIGYLARRQDGGGPDTTLTDRQARAIIELFRELGWDTIPVSNEPTNTNDALLERTWEDGYNAGFAEAEETLDESG